MNLQQLTLTQLRYLVALADTGQFNTAASRCQVTQPTLSMQVQRAEELLGQAVFDRSGHPITPTVVGAQVVEQARIVLSEVERIGGIINATSGELKGTLRLAALPTIAPYLLPLFVPTFRKRFPEVQLRISELRTDEMLAALRRNEIDLGILATPLDEAGLVTDPLYQEPFLIYCSPNHRFAKRNAVPLEELESRDVWLLAEGHCLRNQALNICAQQQQTPNPKIEFESGNIETILRLLDKSDGFTLVPALAEAYLPPKQRRRLRPFDGVGPRRQISLAAHHTFLHPVAARAVKSAILASVPRYEDELAAVVPVRLPRLR